MWVAISGLPLGSADLGRDLKERGRWPLIRKVGASPAPLGKMERQMVWLEQRWGWERGCHRDAGMVAGAGREKASSCGKEGRELSLEASVFVEARKVGSTPSDESFLFAGG